MSHLLFKDNSVQVPDVELVERKNRHCTCADDVGGCVGSQSSLATHLSRVPAMLTAVLGTSSLPNFCTLARRVDRYITVSLLAGFSRNK